MATMPATPDQPTVHPMMPLVLGWPPLDVRYSEVTGAAWRSEGPSQRGDLAFAAPHAAPSDTYAALESSATTVFLVQGEGKRAILDRVLSGDDTVPAGKLRPQGELFWLVDAAAAGKWATGSTTST